VKTGAKIVTDGTHFSLNSQDIHFIFAVVHFTKHCTKTRSA